MRLEYFRPHRGCFFLAVCSCSPRMVRYCDKHPFAATRFAANHARRNPGHAAFVFDMTCLNTVSKHHHVPLPIKWNEEGEEIPPF